VRPVARLGLARNARSGSPRLLSLYISSPLFLPSAPQVSSKAVVALVSCFLSFQKRIVQKIHPSEQASDNMGRQSASSKKRVENARKARVGKQVSSKRVFPWWFQCSELTVVRRSENPLLQPFLRLLPSHLQKLLKFRRKVLQLLLHGQWVSFPLLFPMLFLEINAF
jgi:hypothetical protein